MPQVVLALGSNLGDRRKNIAKMIALLVERKAITAQNLQTAPIIPSKAEHCPPNTPQFLNTCIYAHTNKFPLELMCLNKKIEQELGRPLLYKRNESRSADIDIILYGKCKFVSRNPELTIPHPRSLERSFVIKPMAKILPNFSDFF